MARLTASGGRGAEGFVISGSSSMTGDSSGVAGAVPAAVWGKSGRSATVRRAGAAPIPDGCRDREPARACSGSSPATPRSGTSGKSAGVSTRAAAVRIGRSRPSVCGVTVEREKSYPQFRQRSTASNPRYPHLGHFIR